MADSVQINAGTKEEVAFKIWQELRHNLPDKGVKAQLEFYATCFAHTLGGVPKYDISKLT